MLIMHCAAIYIADGMDYDQRRAYSYLSEAYPIIEHLPMMPNLAYAAEAQAIAGLFGQ